MRECWKDGPGAYVDAVVYSVLEMEWKSSMKARVEERLKWTTISQAN